MKEEEQKQLAGNSLNKYLSQKADVLERGPEVHTRQRCSIAFGK